MELVRSDYRNMSRAPLPYVSVIVLFAHTTDDLCMLAQSSASAGNFKSGGYEVLVTNLAIDFFALFCHGAEKQQYFVSCAQRLIS